MSFKLLHRLMQEKLPVYLTEGADIDRLRVLMLAGLAKGEIAPPVRTLSGHVQPPAAVTEITQMGRMMANRFPGEQRRR
ncbi:hypothetical protein ACSFA8_22330 [Variovorax sp. RT4R15]|uniref:hypothetical protein n=1 Tax=Variovorax sp. RT4R15 TaxID=3443737 RepID=UPI003F47EC0F